jgi:myosin heavy subunit
VAYRETFMSTLAKAFVVVNLVLGLVFVTVSGVLFSHVENWKEKSTGWEVKFKERDAEFETLKATTTERITNLEREKDQLKAALDDKAEEVNRKQTEITKLNNDNRSLDGKNQELSAALNGLKTQWQSTDQSLKTTIVQLERKTAELDRVRADKAASDEQVVRLTAAVGDAQRTVAKLGDQIKEQKADVDRKDAIIQTVQQVSPATWQIVREKSPEKKVPPIRGKVLGVDPETQIVLLSVGREDQVEPNMKFIVYRGAEYIGEVIVDKVLAQQCSARINKDTRRGQIQVGDEVATDIGS